MNSSCITYEQYEGAAVVVIVVFVVVVVVVAVAFLHSNVQEMMETRAILVGGILSLILMFNFLHCRI